MHIMCFTERPYYHVPEEQIIKNASHFGVPNTYFDPIKGSELYKTIWTRRSTLRRWALMGSC